MFYTSLPFQCNNRFDWSNKSVDGFFLLTAESSMLYIYARVPHNELKRKAKKYHAVGTVPNSNRKILESGKIDIPNTQIHDRSLSCIGTGISIKIYLVKLKMNAICVS